MQKNIVFEGWLTKSPPSKRIWRTKWRRRWFSLRHSGELPGQYYLDYFTDLNRQQLKGTINLDFCEQVDAGLHMERGSNGSLDPKQRGSVFAIQTNNRTYHLEADCEADMEKWVDAICRVCGLRAIEDTSDDTSNTSNTSGIYQNQSMVVGNQESVALTLAHENSTKKETCVQSVNNSSYNTVVGRNDQQQTFLTNDCSNATTIANEHSNCANTTGPYIPISECITGVRAQDMQNAFTFDPKNIVISTKTNDKTENKKPIYFTVPQIRINNIVYSENESNFSEDECKSLNNSQSNIDYTVAKTFTKLSLAPRRNNVQSKKGPPVPPRPPKTLIMTRDFSQKELLQAPKFMETMEMQDTNLRLRVPPRMSRGATPPSAGRHMISQSVVRTTDDEDEASMGHLRLRVPPRMSSGATPPSAGRARISLSVERTTDNEDEASTGHLRLRVPPRMSRGATPPSAGRPMISVSVERTTDNEDEASTGHSMQYCNLSTLPPAVDRALKPRYASHSIGKVSSVQTQIKMQVAVSERRKSDTLQYLDLDLPPPSSKPTTSNPLDNAGKPANIVHGKSFSSDDADSAYKTVDFLKTEAFNSTRQDAEASRSVQQ